ncbi:MAG: GIY-YIG nuclease family protein [Candidatus Zixiibacteriota bacterium]|nr:MAG: GIY-YIG nuclease family protein [candidate division Zixibacteria bacterium]
MAYFVYVLQSVVTGTYYIGSTENLKGRLDRHNRGRSKYTKSGKPWNLVYSEEYESRSDAVRRENELKSWKSRKRLEKLMAIEEKA